MSGRKDLIPNQGHSLLGLFQLGQMYIFHGPASGSKDQSTNGQNEWEERREGRKEGKREKGREEGRRKKKKSKG